MTSEECYNKIEILNRTLWENKAERPKIDEWLTNFTTDEEKDYALYMLSRMMYFNSTNIRCLLKSSYRDLFRYPIVEAIRRANGDTFDSKTIESEYLKELNNTRFLGVGNPSESGVHLLYYFRQENRIPKNLFINTDDVIRYDESNTPHLNEAFKDVRRFIFIDDICGSGDQATNDDSNVRRCVSNIKQIVRDAEVSYYMLFGLSKGIKKVREFEYKGMKMYDHVEALITLDESYSCFSAVSRYFQDGVHDKDVAYDIAHYYGYKLAYDLSKREGLSSTTTPTIEAMSKHRALGWGECQLLLSFHHNTPDNTLPIIWYDEDDALWTPIFKRYNKVY